MDLIHSERSKISIYRQISRDAKNLREDWSSLLTKYNIELYDVTLIVSDELGEEKSGLHPYDVFFHYFDRALSSKGFYLVKYCFTTNKDTGYFLLSDETDNLYRLFVRTELEYLRFLYGSIVDPDSNFAIHNVNEIEPQDTYNEKIKVFRRDGSAMDIDKGATVLDFAFYVHTDLGLHFEYAMVDESKTRLPKNTRLSEGDLISVVSNEKILADIPMVQACEHERGPNITRQVFPRNSGINQCYGRICRRYGLRRGRNCRQLAIGACCRCSPAAFSHVRFSSLHQAGDDNTSQGQDARWDQRQRHSLQKLPACRIRKRT